MGYPTRLKGKETPHARAPYVPPKP